MLATAVMSSNHLSPLKTGISRSTRSIKIKREPSPTTLTLLSPMRPPLTGPNKLQLPAINVVPPTPTLTRLDFPSTHDSTGFSLGIDNNHSNPGDDRIRMSDGSDYRHHHQGLIEYDIHPPTPIDLEVISRMAPLKHCYTENNRHMWEEDYQNWCFKAQYYFTTHHPNLHIALPSTRAFGVAQRGPLEKYMLEIDSFPLHPDSETFSTIIANRSNLSREYICFRCGQKRTGSFGSHEGECGYGIPPEQTVYYFAWETVPRPVREEMLLRVPRVWQDAARTEWGRTLCKLDELCEEKELVERKYAGLKTELDGQGKRLRYLETELQRLMEKEKRDDGSRKKAGEIEGKENASPVDLDAVSMTSVKSATPHNLSSSTLKKQKRSLNRDIEKTKSKRQRLR